MQTNADDELVTMPMQPAISNHPNTVTSDDSRAHQIPRPQKMDDISGMEVIAMLRAKGSSVTAITHQHRFNMDDVISVVNGQKCYPNIARLVAQAIGTTKEMLWPSIYCAVPATNQPHTSVFVLRVTLP